MSVVGYFQPNEWHGKRKKKAHNVRDFPRFLVLVRLLVAAGMPNDRRLTVVGAENRSRSGRAVSEFLSTILLLCVCLDVWIHSLNHSLTHSLPHYLIIVSSLCFCVDCGDVSGTGSGSGGAVCEVGVDQGG